MSITDQNPFTSLLDKIQDGLEHERTFIGVYLNTKGQMKILKDETTGKFVWYSSAALLHAEFLKRLTAKPEEYSNCLFYAIKGTSYANNKLLINFYEKLKTQVTHEMLLVFNSVPLEFHKKSYLGMFMPLELNLSRLYEKVKKDPSLLFEAAKRAKHLVFDESKPCTSCGVLCHIPDMKDSKIAKSVRDEVSDLANGHNHYCFDCGKLFIASTVKHAMLSCNDVSKINAVTALLTEVAKLDLNNPSFDFTKAQNILSDLMSYVGTANMFVVDGNDVKQVKSKASSQKPIVGLTKPTEIPNWMN
jgi:hypothetical protein